MVKYCKFCRQGKPADRDHFFANRGNKDGLNNVCRECSKAAMHLFLPDNKPKDDETH